MLFHLEIYDLSSQWAKLLSDTRLELPDEASAWEVLVATREGLPAHCGATMTHGCRNVRPPRTR